MRDVEHATVKIAERHGNTEFLIPPSRLSDIETKSITPSIYRFYSLAVVYHQDIRDLLGVFGVDLNEMAADIDPSISTQSHLLNSLASISAVNMPVRLNSEFDARRTSNFSPMVERWGAVPLSYLAQLANNQFCYAYIGTQDFTMYPILLPGTFVQIDESKNQVATGPWRSEYERPIYFVETREGYICCWCAMHREGILLQPHPLSKVSARLLKFPQAAEVIGQVVGIAMRLEERHSAAMSSYDPLQGETTEAGGFAPAKVS